MNKIKIALFLQLFVLAGLLPAQVYRTQATSPEIHTVQVMANGDWSANPILKLNGNEYVRISFDRISDNSFDRLRYKIIHCDANWKQSHEIGDIDYLSGFNDNPIDDYLSSSNTTVEYTHFNVDIPNKDVNLKLSGNYTVVIYEEDSPDVILLTACFSVLDSQVGIGSSVTSNTDIDSNKGHQQLSITVNHTFNLRNALSEIKVIAWQNNRLDTERRLLKPSFIGGNKLVFDHVRDLIFEAGNEYRRFETASYRYNGLNVGHIEYNRPYYSMYIVPDNVRAKRSYSYDQDQNGRYIIGSRESDNSDTEADYFMTYFSLSADEPFIEDIYLNGDFTNNTFTSKYKVIYDFTNKEYRLSLLLKQGMYNYIYLLKDGSWFSPAQIEGNYSETENEYSIFVYYRPSGQKYDALIGGVTMQSRAK